MSTFMRTKYMPIIEHTHPHSIKQISKIFKLINNFTYDSIKIEKKRKERKIQMKITKRQL